MSKDSSHIPSLYVDGFRLPGMFSKEAVQSVIDYKPRDDDIFIVTYPKCGTTWSHHTLALILRHGENFGENFQLMDSGPFLEAQGMEVATSVPRPCAFRTHLPFRLIPWSDKAKYIYVTRNPKDACVSAFHHTQNIKEIDFEGTFDDFFEKYITGDIECGDYFDHLEGWYKQRNRPNVLFLTYEEMKEDIEAAILKMASFVDDEKYAEPLRKDRQMLDNVVKYSSFKEMKPMINKCMDDFLAMAMASNNAEKSEMPESIQSMPSEVSETKAEENVAEKPKSCNFVRKGIIGDWRNHFSEEQSRRLDEKFAERTKNIEIPEIFKKYM